VVAMIVAVAGSIDQSLVLMGFAPDNFNLGPGLKKTLWAAAVLAMITGVKVGCAYLAKSPLPQPREIWTDEQRAAAKQGNGQK
jgi:hypothetical protein